MNAFDTRDETSIVIIIGSLVLYRYMLIARLIYMLFLICAYEFWLQCAQTAFAAASANGHWYVSRLMLHTRIEYLQKSRKTPDLEVSTRCYYENRIEVRDMPMAESIRKSIKNRPKRETIEAIVIDRPATAPQIGVYFHLFFN